VRDFWGKRSGCLGGRLGLPPRTERGERGKGVPFSLQQDKKVHGGGCSHGGTPPVIKQGVTVLKWVEGTANRKRKTESSREKRYTRERQNHNWYLTTRTGQTLKRLTTEIDMSNFRVENISIKNGGSKTTYKENKKEKITPGGL